MAGLRLHPKVAVIILNWNGRSFLEKFLPSVCETSYPNLELIVGDNASTDSSVAFVQRHFPGVRVICNSKNYGFARGYNQIIQFVEADYFVLLNSDVEVTSGWLEPIIEMMEADILIAAVQPKIRAYYKKDQFEYAGAAGGYIDLFGYPFCRGRIFNTCEADHGQYNQPSEIFWASGAALVVRSCCWNEVQGFDADFFAHMEEVDLCWRLKTRGYKVMYCPNSLVYHVGAGTLNSNSSYKVFLNYKNSLAMLKKNLPLSSFIWIIWVRLGLDVVAAGRYLFLKKHSFAKAIIRADWHFFLHVFSKSSNLRTTLLNRAGIYPRSIVWAYFIRGKTKFSQLKNIF